ncbi:MAG TPA: DUF4194 domain-containing protein [Ktedonobacteraceae bacterium]|nr:DUF4194 domain-containing protein [Ktedonobacteraceae bacterium]
MPTSAVAPYASIILKLLQNPLFSDEAATWNMLLSHLTPIQEHFACIGLEVRLNEEDGYAYLHQPPLEDDEGQTIPLPRLTRRDRLTYHATLLGVLLREWLDQFESTHLDAGKCTITDTQIYELMLPFLSARTDERAIQRRISSAIERLIDLGFLKRMPDTDNPRYFEVRRILKAKIDAEKLAEIKEKLARYGTPVSASE